MNRSRFIAAASAFAALPIGCAPQREAFPGTLAVFAQRVHDTKPFYESNATLVMPAASIIKLVIFQALYDRLPKHLTRSDPAWEQLLTIPRAAIVGSSQVFGTSRPGQRAKLRSLMKAMIDHSDNTAANVLLDWVGMPAVNATAQRLGMHSTRMERYFMDFAARKRGLDNWTTAADVGHLLLYVARTAAQGRECCRELFESVELEIMGGQTDRATIPNGIGSRGRLIANKTGDLPGIRHDAAVIEGVQRPYVLVLMSEGISDHSRALQALEAVAKEMDARAKD